MLQLASRAQPPHSFPAGVRLAAPIDREPLFDIFMAAHRENGFGGVDTQAVRGVIEKAVRHETYAVAVIDGGERIEAVLGLQPARTWYGDDDSWYWTELLYYVRPDARRSRHAIKLLRFAQWFERAAKAPVLITLMPREDFEPKEKLMGRYGERVCSTFMLGDGTFRYMQDCAA